RRVHYRQSQRQCRGRRGLCRSPAPLCGTAFQPPSEEGEGTMTIQTLTKAPRKPKAAAKRKNLQAVTPHLVCGGAADAVEFYKKAFGAVEMMRLPGKDGKLMHASIQIGGATVMLVDELPQWGCRSPKSLKGTPVTIHLYVDDVDAFMDRAVK